MAKAPKSYEAKVAAALLTKRITHQEAVMCLRGDLVLWGSALWDADRGFIDLYPSRAMEEARNG